MSIMLTFRFFKSFANSCFLALPPCLLLFLTGSIFAFGIFTVPIEQSASVPASLDGVWPASMGIMHVLSAPVMVLAGIYLACPPQLKRFRIKFLSIVSSLAFSGIALAAPATKHSIQWLLQLSVALQCVPLGVNYLLLTEVLIAWFPQIPGFIVGCGLVAYNAGVIVLSWAFNELIMTLGCILALYTTSICISVPCLFLSVCLSWPTSFKREIDATNENEQVPLVASEYYEKLTWSSLRKFRNFWLYIFIVFTGGAPYAFTPFFFKLVHVFGRAASLGVGIYQIIGVGGTVVGLLAGWATDATRFGKGFFKSGAKNVAMVLMALQSILFGALIPLSRKDNFWGSMLALGILVDLTSCHYVIAAIMARDLFGAVNGCLVFGIGGGLAVGTGEGLSAWIMSTSEKYGVRDGDAVVPTSYVSFYWAAMFWSCTGLATTLLLEDCKDVFRGKDGQSRSGVEI